MVGPFRANRALSIDVFDIPSLRLENRGREPGWREDLGQCVGYARRHVSPPADHDTGAIADQLRGLSGVTAQRVLHVVGARAARDRRDKTGQTAFFLPDAHLLAVEEITVGMAHAEEQVHGTLARVAAHEAC